MGLPELISMLRERGGPPVLLAPIGCGKIRYIAPAISDPLIDCLDLDPPSLSDFAARAPLPAPDRSDRT